MKKIVFVCHGNICRSPLAEYLFKDMVKKVGAEKDFHIESRATSNEAIGRPPHRETMSKLHQLGISVHNKMATQLRKKDYADFDYFIGMDSYNRRDMVELFNGDEENKVYLLLDFTNDKGDIDDPWYTRDFERACEEIKKGCEALLARML